MSNPSMAGLSPVDVAQDLITRNTEPDRPRRANYRAAELKAWELRKAHGAESPEGQLLASAACEIAELYHDVSWKNDEKGYTHAVPVFGAK